MAFLQENRSIGFDYERAAWLRPKNSNAIVEVGCALGYDFDDRLTDRATLNDIDGSTARMPPDKARCEWTICVQSMETWVVPISDVRVRRSFMPRDP